MLLRQFLGSPIAELWETFVQRGVLNGYWRKKMTVWLHVLQRWEVKHSVVFQEKLDILAREGVCVSHLAKTFKECLLQARLGNPKPKLAFRAKTVTFKIYSEFPILSVCRSAFCKMFVRIKQQSTDKLFA